MAYSDTLVYILNLATATNADLLTALETHWTSAPGYWRISPGVTSVTGESLCIELITAPNCQVNFRRNGSGAIRNLLDPDMLISDAGTTASAPVSSSTSKSDESSFPTGTFNTRVYVIETPDAFFVMGQDATKAFFPWGIHAGVVYVPLRSNDSVYGVDGLGLVIGFPSSIGSPAWFATSTQALGARLKGGLTTSMWAQCGMYGTISTLFNNGAYYSPVFNISDKLVRPIPLSATNLVGSNDLFVGVSKYMGVAPFDRTSFPAQNPRTLLTSSADESWIYVDGGTGSTGFVITWEKGAIPS